MGLVCGKLEITGAGVGGRVGKRALHEEGASISGNDGDFVEAHGESLFEDGVPEGDESGGIDEAVVDAVQGFPVSEVG